MLSSKTVNSYICTGLFLMIAITMQSAIAGKPTASSSTASSGPVDDHIYHVIDIDPANVSLREDGQGSYIHGVDNVGADTNVAQTHMMTGVNGSGGPRAVYYDLNSPVAGSGAVARGVILDNLTRFKLTYKVSSRGNPTTNIYAIPIGSTLAVARLDINIADYMNFRFGNTTYAKMNGIGTTSVLVTRTSATTFTVTIPANGIGRLWNFSTPNPQDLGLYNFSGVFYIREK